MSLGIFQPLISNFFAGVIPVILGNTAQLRVACQLVYLDCNCKETLWDVAVFTLLIPLMDVCLGPW
jgi:hypothetical protein